MTEIGDFATVILLVTAGFGAAVLSTKVTERVPVPAPAVLLIAAALASDVWPALYDSVPIKSVERIAVIALIIILFNGGMEIGWTRFRGSLAPILLLGIVGTFATAAGLAVFAHFALGFSWTLAGLVGAALAPTDPAVVFSVLGKREIGGRSGTTLEGEAGVNDPAGIALMIGLIELATHDGATMAVVVQEFLVEMSIGVAAGLAGAFVLLPLVRRIRLQSEGLYPVLALVLAGALYGGTAIAHGSGFLAVFLAGLIFGDARTPYKGEIERFHTSLAGLAEVVVFVGLGLTVDLGSLTGRIWLEGTALALVLALLIRPAVVVATLAGARLRWAERIFIAWSGLKGAVPVLLAAFAVLAEVADAQRIYGLVFVVVLISVIGQGTPLPLVARLLRIPMHDRPALPWQLAVGLTEEPRGAQEFHLAEGARAAGRQIRHLPLGEHAWITVVVRNGAAIQPNGSLELRPGDRIIILTDAAEDPSPLRNLFEPPATA